MNKKSATTAAVVAAIVAAALIGIAWGVSAWSGDRFGDAAKTVQALGTLAAILAGGLFALYKLQVFRDFQPHLTITHQISHRRIGDSYVHLDVAATLRNGSKTHVEIQDAFFLLQRIAPVSDDEVVSLYDSAFESENYAGFQWTTLEQARRTWQQDELLVEPGESHQETIEFIIRADIDSVLIYTYFHNSNHSKSSRSAEGWHATTVYDIIEEGRPHNPDGGA